MGPRCGMGTTDLTHPECGDAFGSCSHAVQGGLAWESAPIPTNHSMIKHSMATTFFYIVNVKRGAMGARIAIM